MANTLTPIPLCAGCGRDEAPANSCLCTLCTAHLATSVPIRWAQPTAAVDISPTLAFVPQVMTR